MNAIAAHELPSPKESVLNNGEVVVLKLLETVDEDPLRRFFEGIPDRELETLRDDVRDPRTISRWTESLDYRHVMPLVAWDAAMKGIVAVSTLHRMKGVYRHVAEVRIVVGTSHRKLGLGSTLIKELVEIGTHQGLFFLKAEILAENQLAVKAFRQLGFEVKCTLEDYFMTAAGKTRDVVLMMKRLRFDLEEDFFYVF